jgi:hypothetical protein
MSKPKSTVCAAAAALMFLAACAKPAPEPILPAPPAITKPGTTLTANPDPIVVDDGGSIGETAITWSTTAAHTEMHVGTPNGVLFFKSGPTGTVRTGPWVTNGMTFYLQDSDKPDPTSAAATLGSIAVALQ